jgi:hypothetical protein
VGVPAGADLRSGADVEDGAEAMRTVHQRVPIHLQRHLAAGGALDHDPMPLPVDLDHLADHLLQVRSGRDRFGRLLLGRRA